MKSRLKEALRKLLPRTIKRHRIVAGPLRGATIVTSWHDYPGAILGSTERQLLKYFFAHVKQGETWFDIGGHYGYTAIALSRLVGATGRVFTFEPMVNTAGCVSRTRSVEKLEQLTVVPLGLANCQDIMMETLNSIRGMIDSTLPDSASFKETFFVSRLDWLWPRIAGADEHVDGIKIDVQGMEIQVLEGLANIARINRPKLLVEIHKGVSRHELFRVLSSIGYDPNGLCVEPLPGESTPMYADNRTYIFKPAS